MHRPYPSRARALRHVQRTRSAYQYSRVPQRYVLGIDSGRPLTPGEERLAQGLRALRENLRRAQPSTAQLIAALASRRRTA